ncbi:MAG: hypothetical protein QG635_71 [Bacteroidota bacterium]|nr:hypothetical protein [Bacteroidota bacterium]
MIKISITLLIIALMLIGCDGGLSPSEPVEGVTGKSYLNGTLHFIGGKDSWPPVDSIFALRVVAFKQYPPGNIIDEIINNRAYFNIESLELFVDSVNFSLVIADAPVELKYIAVAWQYKDTITYQKAAGVFASFNDRENPTPLSIKPGKSYNISIDVDFNNLPPQPF